MAFNFSSLLFQSERVHVVPRRFTSIGAVEAGRLIGGGGAMRQGGDERFCKPSVEAGMIAEVEIT